VLEGARRMLAAALEEGVSGFLGRHRYERGKGFRGYRNGYHPPRVAVLPAGQGAVAEHRILIYTPSSRVWLSFRALERLTNRPVLPGIHVLATILAQFLCPQDLRVSHCQRDSLVDKIPFKSPSVLITLSPAPTTRYHVSAMSALLSQYLAGFEAISQIGEFKKTGENGQDQVWLFLTSRGINLLRVTCDLLECCCYQQAAMLIRATWEDGLCCEDSKANSATVDALLDGEGEIPVPKFQILANRLKKDLTG
jgi:hypothetical protein